MAGQSMPVTRERWPRVSPRSRCRICGHDSFCLVSPDGTIAGCMRHEPGSYRTKKTGAGAMYMHRLSAEDAAALALARHVRRSGPTVALAPIEERHAVYSAFLEGLTLSARHAEDLHTRRGLDEEVIVRNLYASVPAADKLARHVADLAGQFYLSGIPGFVRDQRDAVERWLCVAEPGELLIPVRDRQGRIQAICRGTGGKR